MTWISLRLIGDGGVPTLKLNRRYIWRRTSRRFNYSWCSSRNVLEKLPRRQDSNLSACCDLIAYNLQQFNCGKSKWIVNAFLKSRFDTVNVHVVGMQPTLSAMSTTMYGSGGGGRSGVGKDKKMTNMRPFINIIMKCWGMGTGKPLPHQFRLYSLCFSVHSFDCVLTRSECETSAAKCLHLSCTLSWIISISFSQFILNFVVIFLRLFWTLRSSPEIVCSILIASQTYI